MPSKSKTNHRPPQEDPAHLPQPSYCCLVVTLRCMLKCKMCQIWAGGHPSGDELTIPEWKTLVKSLDGLLDKKYDIILSGGEPFLKKDILDLVYFCSQAGYRVSLDTNAYLIDATLAKAIGESGLWRICISLDSLNEKTHDFLRGSPGSFSRVMQAIDYLHQLAPKVGINIQTVIMEKNLNELSQLAEWVKADRRLDYIYFQTVVRPFGAPASRLWFKEPKYNFLWPSDIKRVEVAINGLIKLKPANSKIVNSAKQLKAQLAYFKDPLGFAQKQDCTIGNRDININPQGQVYLCFAKEAIGNAKKDGLEKIWSGPAAQAVRGVIKKCKDPCHFTLNCSFE